MLVPLNISHHSSFMCKELLHKKEFLDGLVLSRRQNSINIEGTEFFGKSHLLKVGKTVLEKCKKGCLLVLQHTAW